LSKFNSQDIIVVLKYLSLIRLMCIYLLMLLRWVQLILFIWPILTELLLPEMVVFIGMTD